MIPVLHSIGAVVAGILAVGVLSVGTDALLRAADVFPPITIPMAGIFYALAAFYRTVYGVCGGWLTARLAPSQPMKHALIYGGIGMMLALLGTIATWNKGPEYGPAWYPIFLTVTALPSAWLGARLAFRPAN